MPKVIKSGVTYAQLLSLVPSAPLWRIDWDVLWPLWPELLALDACPQDPVHHAEGDVGTHTRMVVEALVADRAWQILPSFDQSYLFWAAVLHEAVFHHAAIRGLVRRLHDNCCGMQTFHLNGENRFVELSPIINFHFG